MYRGDALQKSASPIIFDIVFNLIRFSKYNSKAINNKSVPLLLPMTAEL